MNIENYTKITYESNPIGKERIILQLTTFDLETFKNDEKLEKIPLKKKDIAIEFDRVELLNNPNLVYEMTRRFDEMFEKTYKNQLEEMKSYIEILRNIKIVPIEYSKEQE